MKATLLGIAVFSLGIGLLASLLTGQSGAGFPRDVVWLQGALGGVLTTAGVSILVTAFSGRSARRALMRLDIFLPYLIKPKKNSTTTSPSVSLRIAKWLLPSWLFSVPDTRKPGFARKVLKRLGATTLSSPGRRIIQTACLLLFLILFFHVCWPYSAQPELPGKVSEGWRIESNDQQSGVLQLDNETSPDLQLQKNSSFT